MIFGFIFKVLAGFNMGRKLLLDYPRLFSYGIFSHEGPSARQLKETSFEMTLFTSGYKSASSSSIMKSPDDNIVVRVVGPEPGYVATPILFVQCYKTLIEEVISASRPATVHNRGGVVTPAVAFAGTTLINRLRNRGIDFIVAK